MKKQKLHKKLFLTAATMIGSDHDWSLRLVQRTGSTLVGSYSETKI
jgi:hypothetical protein